MPRIAQYENPITGLQPTETGIEATAAAARRSGMFFNQVAGGTERVGHEFARIGGAIAEAGNAAVDYMDHEQIHKGALAASALIAGKTNEWNQTFGNSDPNDPTVAPKFMEGLNTDLENLRGSMLTERSRNWMEAHTEQIRNPFTTTTIADVASAHGIAAQNNAVGVENNLANAAYRNPAGLFNTLDLAKEQLGAIYDSSGLKGVAAIKAKTEGVQRALTHIANEGVRGWIATSKDPEATLERLSADPRLTQYITPSENAQWAKAAKAAAKTNMLTDKQMELYAKTQAANAGHAALSKNFTDNVSFDENGRPTVKPDYYKNIMEIEQRFGEASGGGTTARAEQMIKFGQNEQREKRETIISDQSTRADLYNGMFKTENPTSDVDILKAANEHKLDAHDTSDLLRLHAALEQAPLKGPIYQTTMQAIKDALGDSEKGHLNFANFTQEFIPAYLKISGDPVQRAKALNLRDPNSLISQTLDKWKLDPREKLMGHIMKRIGAGGEITPNMLDVLQGNKPAPGPSKNIGETVGTPQVIDIPKNMSPAEAIKWVKDNNIPSGSKVRLPNGDVRNAP